MSHDKDPSDSRPLIVIDVDDYGAIKSKFLNNEFTNSLIDVRICKKVYCAKFKAVKSSRF